MKAGGARPRWLHQGRVLALIFYGEHSSGLLLYGLACAQGEALGTPSSPSTQGPLPGPGTSWVPEPWPRCATMAQPPRWHGWRAAQPPAVVQDLGGARAAPMPRAAWCEVSMSDLEFQIFGCGGLVSLGLLSPSVN